MSGVCPMRVERFHGPVWGCWCGRDRWLGWACPVREWYGCAFGFPDRHPTVVSIVARFRCPCGVAGVRWTRGGTRGAWRFENWIVDASKRNMVFLFAYRDFAKLFFFEFGFEIDRFVII